jgi:ATP-dependent helicase/nuclease subunit B
VDLWRATDSDEAWAVIIDYKSSGAKLDPVFLHHGMQLQLLSYLNALLHLPEPEKTFGVSRILPGGMFYVPLRARPDSAETRREAFEQADETAASTYQHTGRFDAALLLKLDNRGLERSDQFKFAKKKDGTFAKRGNEAMSAEDFGVLLKKIAADLETTAHAIGASARRCAGLMHGSIRSMFCESRRNNIAARKTTNKCGMPLRFGKRQHIRVTCERKQNDQII